MNLKSNLQSLYFALGFIHGTLRLIECKDDQAEGVVNDLSCSIKAFIEKLDKKEIFFKGEDHGT